MSNNIYTNCYNKLWGDNYPLFMFMFIGGRGIGKTFSMLKGALDDNKRIIYVRRTQTEIDNCCNDYMNPFKAINKKCNRNVHMKALKDSCIIVEDDQLIGYACSLKTFGKYRGADFSDVQLILFDEFIQTTPGGKIKNESTYFLNLIETIQRNREFEGDESVKLVLLSNANTINNEIITYFNLGEEIRQLKINNQSIYKDEERGIYLELLENKEVQNLKKETALYKLTKGTNFYDFSLNNEFTDDNFGLVKKIDYRELVPMCAYNDIYFYKHKSKNIIYATKRKCSTYKYNTDTFKAFKRDFGFMINNYKIRGLILCGDYNIKLKVDNLLNI